VAGGAAGGVGRIKQEPRVMRQRGTSLLTVATLVLASTNRCPGAAAIRVPEGFAQGLAQRHPSGTTVTKTGTAEAGSSR